MERAISNSAVIGLIFILIGTLFLVIKKISPSKVAFLFSSFFINREFKQHLKEEYFIKNYTTFFLCLVASFSLATCLTLTAKEFIVEHVFSVLLFILAVLTLKITLSYFLSKTINPTQTIIKSIYTLEVLFLVVLGLVALFFIPIELFYSVYAIRYGVFIALIVVYCIKIGKQFLYSLENKTPLFYIILYFCAFEIIPTLTLVKIVGLI